MFLYVIKDSERPRYKLGLAKNVSKRLKQHQTGSPSLLELSLTVRLTDPNPRVVETSVHGAFRDKRLHGEWFALTPEDVTTIPSLINGTESRTWATTGRQKISIETLPKTWLEYPGLRKRMGLLEGHSGKITSQRWAKITKCSHDTALRDMEALVELEILKRSPEGGRSTSYEPVVAGA